MSPPTGTTEQCPIFEVREDNFPRSRCAYVAGHTGTHRFPAFVQGQWEDLSHEIRAKRSADSTLDALNTAIGQVAELQEEVAMWKRRAAQHGCNVEDGDHECG